MIILLIPTVISCDNSLFAPPKFCLTKNNGYTILVVGGGDAEGLIKLYYGRCAKWVTSACVDIVER